jgi:hypothetical protein
MILRFSPVTGAATSAIPANEPCSDWRFRNLDGLPPIPFSKSSSDHF